MINFFYLNLNVNIFLIVIVIVAFSLTLPGASIGYTQIFTPNWSALTNLNVWLAAFGQIVFSLSLGMSIALTYASYLPEDSKLTDNALIVAFSNLNLTGNPNLGVYISVNDEVAIVPFNLPTEMESVMKEALEVDLISRICS